MESSLSHRNTTLRYSKRSKYLAIVFTTFSQSGKSFFFAGIKWAKIDFGHSVVHHQDGTVSALLDADIVVLAFCDKKN